jgi:hydrogenase maturation protease
MRRILVLGLGNPLLGDDGVGWRVVEECIKGGAGLGAAQVEFDVCASGGMEVMERLIGYDHVILVDAINDGEHAPGHVECFPLQGLPVPVAGHTGLSHDVTLQAAMDVGRGVGVDLPECVMVVAIETRKGAHFSEELSPEVAAAVPHAAEKIRELLKGFMLPD